MNARAVLIAGGFVAALALHVSRCQNVHVPARAIGAPTGVGNGSGPTGLTALPPGVPVAPGAMTSTGQPLRIGEAFANSFDPSDTGLVRPHGSFAYSRNGAAAWMKTGVSSTSWTSMTAIDAAAAIIGNVTSDRILGRDTAGIGPVEQLTVGGGLEFTGSGGLQRSALTGDVTASAGSGSTTIANDAVTNAKLANMANSTIKCRTTAGTGDPEDCTGAQVGAIIGASGGGAMVLVSSQDVSSSPITWSSLTGDASTTLGYQIYGRVRGSTASTQVALRVNNDTGSNYQWIRTDNDGATVSGAIGSSATSIAIFPAVLGNDQTLAFSVFVPVSGDSGTGFAREKGVTWMAQSQDAATAGYSTGGGAYLVTGQITRLDLVATAGGFEAGTRAALYRITR